MTDSTILPDNKQYPEYTRTFAEVYLAELDYIKKRRGKIHISSRTVEDEYERVCKELDGKEECKRKWVYKECDEREETHEPERSQTGVLGFLERFRVLLLFGLLGLSLVTLVTTWYVNELTIWRGFSVIISWFLWFILLKPLFLTIAEESKSSHPKIKISTKANLVGLALSGGGVRSATFNLGLLQSLAKNKVLQYCDYLSTVSGGGYIGSCLTSLLASNAEASTEPDKFPLRNQHDGSEEQVEVNYLRKTRNYLGFGRGLLHLETWQTMGTILTGFLLMMTIPLAILLGITLGLWKLDPGEPSFQQILIVALTINFLGLLWIMFIRLRQVSVFWEWLWMILIPQKLRLDKI